MSKIPCFIIEEHHEAFIVWFYAIKNRLIDNYNNILFHFDDHSDMNTPRLNISINDLMSWDMEKLKSFVYSELSIASFIIPATYLKFFNQIVWIKHQMSKEISAEMFVRSFNNDGLKLVSFKYGNLMREKLKHVKKIKYLYDKVDAKNFNEYIIDKDSSLVLDIDLDYFSCADDTYFTNEVLIETTKQEYENFVDNKYHMLRFISGKVQEYKADGKYYFLFNYYKYTYPEPRKVTFEEILNRILKFEKTLIEKKITPKLITICRSRHSGFTPTDQWEFIEENILKILNNIYEIDNFNLKSLELENYAK